MLERFSNYFTTTSSENLELNISLLDTSYSDISDFLDFFKRFSGFSFNHGLYRVHSPENIKKWTSIVEEYYPEFSGSFICFSCDWLGKQFALRKSSQNIESQVLIFDIATGEVLDVPSTFEDFHDRELVDYDPLASEYFNEWLAKAGTDLRNDQCVGYKIPLFMGGNDDIDNLVICDMELNWSISGQLLLQVNKLADGTQISKINIKIEE